MTELKEVSDTPEETHLEFRKVLDQFRAETQLSMASTAKLLDVNPGSMSKWYRKDPETGRLRTPQKYVMDAGMLKIRRLNAHDEETGLYSKLRGLKPSDRVALLLDALDSRYVS